MSRQQKIRTDVVTMPTVVGAIAQWFLKSDGLPSDAAAMGAPRHVVEMMKATTFGMGTGDADALVLAQQAAEALLAANAPGGWFSALRPDTVPGELNGRYVIGQSRPSAGQAREGRAIKLGRMDFGARVLEPRSVAGVVVVSSELLRFASGAAILERALREAVDAATDAEFGPELMAGIPSVAASGAGSRDVLKDLRVAMAAIPSGTEARFHVAVGIELAKRLATAPNAVGDPAFPRMTPGGGFLGPLPCAVTAALGDDVVVTDATAVLTAADALELDRSSASAIEMDDAPSSTVNDGASPRAAVGTQLVSLFQAGAVALRAKRHYAWQPIRPVHSVRIAGAGQIWGLDDTTSPAS